MARRWIVGCAVLAACGNTPPGITLEVTPPTGTARVEVFLGVGPCMTGDQNSVPCKDIGPPNFKAKKPGDGFALDSDMVNEVAVTGGTIVLRIEPRPGGDSYVDRMVVVGWDANDRQTGTFVTSDVTIPANDAVVWKVTLATLAPVAEQASSVDGDHVLAWRPLDTTKAGCVLVEHASAGHSTYEFIVPGDHDCDNGSVVRDCDPLWYQAPKSPYAPRALASCIVASTNPAPVGPCVLGGPACDETSATLAGCVPTQARYCFPDAMCRDCGDPNNQFGPACMSTVSDATINAIPYQRCNFNPDPNNSMGPCTSNSLDHGTFDGVPLLVAAGSSDPTCTDVKLRNLDPASPTNPIVFTQTATPSYTASGSTAMFSAQLTNGSTCMVDLKWESGTGNVLGYLLVDLVTDNGHVVVPMGVSFEAGGGQCPTMPSNGCYQPAIPPLTGTRPFEHCLP